ncbi:hypothetical protein LBMAG53_32410 [Planctomycetota bacterium]|nr:hypothetical protein LBMAG53_32410 [Planctomycetota bacterium]
MNVESDPWAGRLDAYRDGSLNEVDAAALWRQVAEAGPERRRFIELTRLDRQIAAELEPIGLAARIQAELLADDRRYTARVVRSIRARRPRRWLAWPLAAGLVAAALAVSLAVALLNRHATQFPDPSPTVVHVDPPRPPLASCVGPLRLTRHGAGLDALPGAALEAGDRVLATAGSGIRFPDGTMLTLTAGSDLRLDLGSDGGKRLDLTAGSLSASVAAQPPGAPLRLATPHLTATVLGTRLEMMAEAARSTCAVVEGKVRVEAGADRTDLATGGWAEARPGQALRTGPWSMAGLWAACVTSGVLRRDSAGTVTGAGSITVKPEQQSPWFTPDQIICLQSGELDDRGPVLAVLPEDFVITVRLRSERPGVVGVTIAPAPPRPEIGLGVRGLPITSDWSDLRLTADLFLARDNVTRMPAGAFHLWTMSIWGFGVGQVEIAGMTVERKSGP